MKQLQEKYVEEHFELLEYRAGLLKPDNASPEKSISCGHDEVVERNGSLLAELNLMEQINGALEEKTVEL